MAALSVALLAAVSMSLASSSSGSLLRYEVGVGPDRNGVSLSVCAFLAHSCENFGHWPLAAARDGERNATDTWLHLIRLIGFAPPPTSSLDGGLVLCRCTFSSTHSPAHFWCRAVALSCMCGAHLHTRTHPPTQGGVSPSAAEGAIKNPWCSGAFEGYSVRVGRGLMADSALNLTEAAWVGPECRGVNLGSPAVVSASARFLSHTSVRVPRLKVYRGRSFSEHDAHAQSAASGIVLTFCSFEDESFDGGHQ